MCVCGYMTEACLYDYVTEAGCMTKRVPSRVCGYMTEAGRMTKSVTSCLYDYVTEAGCMTKRVPSRVCVAI